MANPNENSAFAQFALDLQSATQGVPGIVADQVMIGQVEFYASTDFYQKVADNGYYVFVGMPSGEASFVDYNGRFDVTVEILYPVPADVSYDWIVPNNMLASIISGWAHYTTPSRSQWVTGNNRSAIKVRFEKPEIRYSQKACSRYLGNKVCFIVGNKLVASCPFIADQAVNPYLSPAKS